MAGRQPCRDPAAPLSPTPTPACRPAASLRESKASMGGRASACRGRPGPGLPGFGAPTGQVIFARMFRNPRRTRAGVSRPGGAGRAPRAGAGRRPAAGRGGAERGGDDEPRATLGEAVKNAFELFGGEFGPRVVLVESRTASRVVQGCVTR